MRKGFNMTVYRLPFEDDGAWQLLPQANWDDPATGPHQPYAFDFNHAVGANIRASRGGVVIFVENHAGNSTKGDAVPGYGTAILIRHIDGTVTAYNHLEFQSTKVVKNQVVLQGQVIAHSGNTGQSYAPHLHFGAVTFWNDHDDAGVDFPMQFQDKNHVAWRPRINDPLASNNSTLRQEGWRRCQTCRGLFFLADLAAGGGACPSGGSHTRGSSPNYVLSQEPATGEAGWRWCSKCAGLFFGGNAGSKCPTGGTHSGDLSGQYVVAANAPNAPGEQDWRWCKKCHGLFFGTGAASKCPGGGEHSKDGSANYTLVRMGPGDPQRDWRWCNKCQGLFFGGNSGSKCPGGGEHKKTSGNYTLVHDYLESSAPGQPDWRWCGKCQGLFFGGNPGSKCPGGGEHSKAGSGNYTLVNSTSPMAPGQAGWRWCHKCQGLFFGDNVGSKCPGGGEHSKAGSGNYRIPA
ncbi:MAG: M23 family metallopeptidase [Acidimicrobiales bacterium]